MTIIKIYDGHHSEEHSEHEYSKFKKCANEEMTKYVEKHGYHFSKALCEFAVSKMTKNGSPVKMQDKSIVDALLETYNVSVENDKCYDTVFVFHMAKADFWGSSITEEANMAKYIKDVLDDTDGYEGVAFNRWYADMCMTDTEIDWASML